MNTLRNEILNTLYQNQQQGELETFYDFNLNDFELRNKYVTQFHYLCDKGYLKINAELTKGGFILQPTAKGIDYVENNFRDIQNNLSGSNNIIVNGSNNIISNNYINLINNIKNSSISDEYKVLIVSLLTEIKNNNIHKETIFNKTKTIISNIINESVTSVGINVLTTLFTELISNFK